MHHGPSQHRKSPGRARIVGELSHSCMYPGLQCITPLGPYRLNTTIIILTGGPRVLLCSTPPTMLKVRHSLVPPSPQGRSLRSRPYCHLLPIPCHTHVRGVYPWDRVLCSQTCAIAFARVCVCSRRVRVLALDHVVCSLNPYHALRRVLLFILLQLVVVHREGGIQI